MTLLLQLVATREATTIIIVQLLYTVFSIQNVSGVATAPTAARVEFICDLGEDEVLVLGTARLLRTGMGRSFRFWVFLVTVSEVPADVEM